MLCTELSKVKRHGKALIVEPLRCKRWTCETCRPMLQKMLIAKALGGEPTTFITLTIRASWGTLTEQAQRLVEAWRMIRQSYARQHHGHKIPFLAVFEAHPSTGRPHLHILCRANYIPQRWLSDRMRSLAGSPVCDIRRVNSTRHAARYLAKYVGKDARKFAGTKRYWRSHDYDLRPKEARTDRTATEVIVIREPYDRAIGHAAMNVVWRGTDVRNRRVEIDFRRHEVRWLC